VDEVSILLIEYCTPFITHPLCCTHHSSSSTVLRSSLLLIHCAALITPPHPLYSAHHSSSSTVLHSSLLLIHCAMHAIVSIAHALPHTLALCTALCSMRGLHARKGLRGGRGVELRGVEEGRRRRLCSTHCKRGLISSAQPATKRTFTIPQLTPFHKVCFPAEGAYRGLLANPNPSNNPSNSQSPYSVGPSFA
jgi:hypothetical protein